MTYEYEPTCNFDTLEYRMYREAIFSLLAERGAMLIREIHEALGYDRQRYTADVLEDAAIEASWAIPTRYSLRARRVKDIRYTAHYRPEDAKERKARRPDGGV